MKKIVNIVSEKPLVNHEIFDWVNYYDYNTWKVCNVSLPTLIIGWNFYRKEFSHLYPNILHKKSIINPLITWEFSMTEKMTDYFNGVETFLKSAPKEFCYLTNYKAIDPISSNVQKEEDLLKYFVTENTVYYQYKEEIIYVLDKTENTITGIFLNAYKYFQFDVQKITTLFANKFPTKTIDSDGMLYQSYYKHFPDFDQLKRTMVLFLY